METKAQNETLFYRSGQLFTGKVLRTEKGKPYAMEFKNCNRCGGAGGSDKWAHTGWTCFECGGSKGRMAEVKLYTAEKISKMNAANDKRAAKKAEERAALAAAIERDRAARREQFSIEHKQYFDGVFAVCGHDGIAKEIIQTATRLANLTENQKAALDKMVAEIQRKEATQYIGEIGTRHTFTCTLVNLRVFDNKFGYRNTRSYMHIMRDASGNTVKYTGSAILVDVKWEGKYDDAYPVWDKQATFTFVATVKEHTEYKGEKQTVVARPKVQEAK